MSHRMFHVQPLPQPASPELPMSSGWTFVQIRSEVDSPPRLGPIPGPMIASAPRSHRHRSALALAALLCCIATACAMAGSAIAASAGKTTSTSPGHGTGTAVNGGHRRSDKQSAARKAAAKRAAARRAALKRAAARRAAAKKAAAAKLAVTSKLQTQTSGGSLSAGGSSAGTSSSGSTGTGTSSASGGPVSAPLNSIYWGAYVGTQFTGETAPWDMNTISDFEQEDSAGKGMSIVPFYMPFEQNATSWYPFPSDQLSSIRSDGAIPLISWGSYSLADSSKDASASNAADPSFSLQDIINGDYDSYIRSFAETAKAWGHPFFLRFDWEMNGNWYPWSEQASDNSPGQFVAAWRHVHDIFTSVGATNASWVWCPNVDEGANTTMNLSELYPGDAYVDWTCMDAYNTGTEYAGNSWENFDQVAGSTYTDLTQIAPTKPVMLGEFNSTSAGGTQASWIAQTLADVPVNYPDIKAVILFDANSSLAIEGSPASKSAFAKGIADPVYAGNNYANLDSGP